MKKCLFESLFSVTLNLYLGVKLLDQLTTLNFSRKSQTIFHSGYTIFLFHRQWRRILISLYTHPHLLFPPFLLFYCHLSGYEGFPGSLAVKNLPAIQEMRVWSLGWEDPWEKEMATHFSILVCEIPWTEKPGRLQLMGLKRVGHNLATKNNSNHG